MRNPILFLLVVGLLHPIFAQKLQLHDLKFSDQIQAEREAAKLSKSAAAYYYTYIGKYQQALAEYEVPLAWGLDKMTEQEKKDFQQYQAVEAYEYLRERTVDQQVVIISEAHQKPQHRVFTRNTLSLLYDNGFRYLGLETLTPDFEDSTKFQMDMLLNKRGYPLYSPFSGSYTREPQMSNMIREAIDLGFTIFGYERNGRGERDLEQAQNIKRFMDGHPDGKVVIHCGWYHAIESDFPKRKTDNYMAYHLKQLSGIDPLTIYQDVLTERVLDAESPYYQAVNSDEVSVLVNDAGEAFNGKPGVDHFDILIYHPKTSYRKNRPSWLYRSYGYTFVKVKRDKINKDNYPILVKAYLAGEPETATPVDIIELLSPSDKTCLILRRGKYRVVLEDQAGKAVEYPLVFD